MTNTDFADPKQDHTTSSVVSEEFEEGLGRLDEPPKSPSARDQWFTDIVNRWKKHSEHGLSLRYETGSELNRRIGPPTGRQEKHGEVVKALAVELQVHESEISRMRNFAFVFSQFKLFRMEHPDVRTWSQVKAKLPEWSGNAGGKSSGGGTSGSGEAVKLVTRSIRTVTARLEGDEFVVDELDRDELILELKKLGRALQKRVGVTLNAVETPEEDSAD